MGKQTRSKIARSVAGIVSVAMLLAAPGTEAKQALATDVHKPLDGLQSVTLYSDPDLRKPAEVWTVKRDASGRPQLITSTVRAALRLSYDAQGRLIAVGNVGGPDTGRQRGTGFSDSYEYDALGRLVKRCHQQHVGVLAVVPNNHCTFFEYDPSSGRLIRQRTEGRYVRSSVDLRYDLDGKGRVVRIEQSAGGKTFNRRTFAYDAQGRRVEESFDALHTRQLEERIVYSYGASGRPSSKVRITSGTFGDGTARFRYDAQGRLVEVSGYLSGLSLCSATPETPVASPLCTLVAGRTGRVVLSYRR